MGKSNVHPDHYKTAGRERQGDAVVSDDEKAKMKVAEARRRARRRKRG